MTEHQFSLAPFYAGWDVYQQHLVGAIAPLTAEQLALRSSLRTRRRNSLILLFDCRPLFHPPSIETLM